MISEVYKIYMDINFEYYKIFYFVAKYRSITKAATALGRNQPNVSRIMKLLEEQLNCRLLIREARGITLTKEGELLYSHVEIAYRQLINAQEEIRRQDSLGFGTVELGVTETALHLFLMEMLRKFKLAYPGIRIKIHNHSTPETIRFMASGRLDFALITSPFTLPHPFSCVKVLDFEDILVGGAQYGDLRKARLNLQEVQRFPWIALGKGSGAYQLYREFFIDHGVDWEPDMEVATSDLMLPLIENHLGIGFVPKRLAAPLLKQGKLVEIHLDCAIPKRSIQLVSDKERRSALAANTFYRYLMKEVT